MPAIQQKRTIQSSALPVAKKVKTPVEDPVMAKVTPIAAALQTDSFVLPGTKANREMLVAMAPAVLATPSDVRHAHQQAVADILKEVFVTEEARLTQRVLDAEAKVTEVGLELAESKGVAATAELALNEKNEQIKAKQAELAAEVHVTKNAESTVKDVMSELSNLAEVSTFDTEEQEVAVNMNTKHFLVLKDGSWEGDTVPKEHAKALVSFFKKIRSDASMVAALPMALGRKPTERSEFDSSVVTELNVKLDAHLTQLMQKIESNVAAITEKKTERDTADAALAAAQTKQRLSAEALLGLKTEQKQRTTELSQKQQVVIVKEFEVQAVQGHLAEEKVKLEAHQSILSDLTELLERCAPVPEAGVHKEVAEEVMEMASEPVQEPAM